MKNIDTKMESHSAQHLIDPASTSCLQATSRPISQFPATLLRPRPLQDRDGSYSNAPSCYPSRSSTPLSMSLSWSSFSETETESHSGQSPCATSSPGPSTPREWAISSPSIPCSSPLDIYSRPTLPGLSALFPELHEHGQDYRHHQPKHHGLVPTSHQQRRDHRRLPSDDDDDMDIYSEHLTSRPRYQRCEYHEYQPQHQQCQRYACPRPPPYYRYGDEDTQGEHRHYASLRSRPQTQARAQAQAQATSPSAPVPLHLTRSSSPSAAWPASSFPTSFPISSSSFASSHSSSRPTQHTPHTPHTHTHRRHPHPPQHRYIHHSQCDTNNREMFHSQSSLPPSPSHLTPAHHPHHPYHHSRNNSTRVPPREAPSPLLSIDVLQAKTSSSSSFMASSASSLLPSSSHFAVYSHNQSYQNLLSALPKSSPTTPKVEPAMQRYSRFGSTSPPPQGPAHGTSLPMGPRNNMKTRSAPTPYSSPALTDEELHSDWSRSPSLTRDTMEYGSPQLTEYFDGLSEDGSDSTISLISDRSLCHFDANHTNNSYTTGTNIPSSPTSPSSSKPAGKLLLCPVCDKAFKPSKNQNCNLRRHLKNVHDMSPAIHPRKCKWDSLPDGRVKDDKDRKERTRKSKRLWARKFRLRRKVEEAAEVLSMLNQAN